MFVYGLLENHYPTEFKRYTSLSPPMANVLALLDFTLKSDWAKVFAMGGLRML